MSVDIILKHSNQAGKEPDAGSLKQGELAINTKDVKAYIKNADGQVVQIAGADNPTTDGRYVKLEGDGTAQEITGTGGLKTEGLLESGGGVTSRDSVLAELPAGAGKWAIETKTKDTSNSSGFFRESDSGFTATVRSSSGRPTSLKSNGSLSLDSPVGGTTPLVDFKVEGDLKSNIAFVQDKNLLSINSAGNADLKLGGGSGNVGINVDPGEEALKIGGEFTYSASSTFIDNTLITPDIEGSTQNGYTTLTISPTFDSSFTTPQVRGLTVQARGDVPETVAEYYGIRTPEVTAGANLTTKVHGFWSGINQPAGSERYNFMAAGDAPNFFKGNTYIGGSVSRNTRELWESTLTEEQLEQLAAGTLTVPANVSNPGDGSFVRQWWYNQQSAEDQALIDSGELDYPKRYQAANFVDTFELGDDTNINLLSNGRGEFGGGVVVSGGTDQLTGISGDSQAGKLVLSPGGTTGRPYFIQRNSKDEVVHQWGRGAGDGRYFFMQAYPTVNSSYAFNVQIDPEGSLETLTGAAVSYNGNEGYRITGSGYFGYEATAGNPPNNTETINTSIAFVARDRIRQNTSGKCIGFDSQFSKEDGKEVYNFYANGNAPNFLKGDTYIGGNTTRNTRELWESTLTEEQKEQLSAGTLAIPANVSTPGDGSFVRQWWYNQQSAEDQALIDAGELDYPERYQPANFVDTFELGDDTNIDLMSGGLGKFGGGVRVTGGSAAGVEDGIARSASTLNLIKSSKARMFVGDDRVGVIGALDTTASETVGLSVDVTIPEGVTTHSAFKLNAKGTNTSDSVYRGVWFTGQSASGSWSESRGVFIGDDADIGDTNYGIYSALNNPNDKTNYNFYAEGTAPNYFKGDVTGGGTGAAPNWSIAADGTATGITVTRASVVTDDQAGTVETLLDIITDLRARITELESGSGGGGSDFESRVAALEVDMARFKAI